MAPIGAASLLYKNADEQWPEETADDLVALHPGIAFDNLAADGATIGDVFGDQLPHLGESNEPTLVTLTIGGNDLLSAFSTRPRRPLLDKIVGDIVEAYDFLVDMLRGRLAGGTERPAGVHGAVFQGQFRLHRLEGFQGAGRKPDES